MDIDFSFYLVLAVFISGVAWLYDVLVLLPKRQGILAECEKNSKPLDDVSRASVLKEPLFAEYGKSFFPVLFIVLLLRSFVFEPFTIPSGSMLPTLQVGDYILVNKFTYGGRLPVVGTKLFSLNDPKRGDVLVFKYPKDPKDNFIKRVVGLPGDRLEYKLNTLFINGKEVSKQKLDRRLQPFDQSGKVYLEQLGEKSHLMRRRKSALLDEQTQGGGRWAKVVPEGHYFVMGDNRDNSSDSRFWGTVAEEYVVGKAVGIWMHKEPGLNFPSFGRSGVIDKEELDNEK